MVDLASAYAACLRAARCHYENFPVASILVPRRLRPHVAAVYAFARAADDFADEGTWPAAAREQLLDGWRARLHHAADTPVAGPPPASGEPVHTVEIFLALGHTMRTRALPVPLFDDLLSAFRQDVRVGRYETWDDLFDYCRRSANPVGRLVLRLAGCEDTRLDGWSDAFCTALQLTNFWQDTAIDAARGRVYLPAEERRRHGASDAPVAQGRLAPGWKPALEAAAHRTRALYRHGRPVCDAVRGRLRLELRATWLGGMRILDRLDASGFDVVAPRPTLGMADVPRLAWAFARWQKTAHEAMPPVSAAETVTAPRGGRRP